MQRPNPAQPVALMRASRWSAPGTNVRLQGQPVNRNPHTQIQVKPMCDSAVFLAVVFATPLTPRCPGWWTPV